MEIRNTTKRPLKVPLPGGKKLFLGLAGKGSLVIFCGEDRHTIPFATIKSVQALRTRLSQPIGKQRIRLEAKPDEPGGVAYVVYRVISLGR